jgi:antitoxin VapB
MKKSARAADPDGGGAATISARAADADRRRTAKGSAGKDGNRGRAAKKKAGTVKTVVTGPRDGRKFARVFMSGRSQAVRLPKEFRFDTDRVIIRREGRHVLLSPPFKDWEDYWKNGTRFPDDFYEAMEELDKEALPLEEREPFD